MHVLKEKKRKTKMPVVHKWTNPRTPYPSYKQTSNYLDKTKYKFVKEYIITIVLILYIIYVIDYYIIGNIKINQ